MIINKTLQELLNELNFQLKMENKGTINSDDFRNAVEELVVYYTS